MTKNYEKILKQLERKLSKLISTMLKAGASESAIKKAVKKMIIEFNPYSRLSKQFEKDAEIVAETAFKKTAEKLFWIENHTRPKISSKALNTVLAVNNQFALLQNQLNKKVLSAVEKAIKEDLKSSELTDLIAESVDGGRYRANTIANTALQGYSAANNIEMEREAGIKKWVYSGVPPERSFCKNLIGKIKTYEEIQALDNSQGLSVLYFGGGYNCPHYWEAVIDDELLNELGVI